MTVAESMYNFGKAKLERCLTTLGYQEFIPKIEKAFEEKTRVLYQLLPFRIYVYDLTEMIGRLDFCRISLHTWKPS